MGIKFILGGSPTPFSPQFFVPVNTHAIVSFRQVHSEFISNCWKTGQGPAVELIKSIEYYTQEVCLVEFLEKRSYNICKCHFIAGDYFPRNDMVCTPEKTRKCAAEFLAISLSEVNYFYNVILFLFLYIFTNCFLHKKHYF